MQTKTKINKHAHGKKKTHAEKKNTRMPMKKKTADEKKNVYV